MRKPKPGVTNTILRMPTGVHRLLTGAAKRNNRSINSEILWALAQHLGGDAPRLVEEMAVEKRRAMHKVLQALIKDPERAAQAIANYDKRTKGES